MVGGRKEICIVASVVVHFKLPNHSEQQDCVMKCDCVYLNHTQEFRQRREFQALTGVLKPTLLQENKRVVDACNTQLVGKCSHLPNLF